MRNSTLLFMTTIVITVACTKVPVAIDSISTAPSYALTKTTTSTDAGNYCVTKELAAEYIRNSVGGEKPFSITAYPSEENALMFVVSFDEGVENNTRRFPFWVSAGPKRHGEYRLK